MFCKWNERCDGSEIVSCQARVQATLVLFVLDNRRRGRGFVCDNRDRCSEKFKAGWYCVQNSFCSFLMGGRQHIWKSFVCQQTGGQSYHRNKRILGLLMVVA